MLRPSDVVGTTVPAGLLPQGWVVEVAVQAAMAPALGWRVAGSLNADVRIAGTRADPRWEGSLGADGFQSIARHPTAGGRDSDDYSGCGSRRMF